MFMYQCGFHSSVCVCGNDRREFGMDSFISPTLLSNMREKDLRKAISYHLKKIQSLLEPRQKVGNVLTDEWKEASRDVKR